MFFPLYLLRLNMQSETIMYDLIWISKPAKMKRALLSMDYEKGDKMIDLKTFIKTLKNMLDTE